MTPAAGRRPVRIVLVRHAMPELDPTVAARQWRLGEAGHAAARTLALPAGAYLVASAEPKAIETIRSATGVADVPTDAGFAEVRRPATWTSGHQRLAREYIGGATHDGWEPREEVVARFDAAITRHAARAAGRPLVVGTHGMVMTCWLAAQGLITGDPGGCWSALSLPDVVDVERVLTRWPPTGA